MNLSYLLMGMILGMLLLATGMMVTGEEVDPDLICNGRLDGSNWQGEKVNTDYQNQSMTLECENDRIGEVQNITVDINIEVQSG